MVFFKFNGLILVELLNIQTFFSSFNKMKKKYHTVGTILKSNNNIVERGKIAIKSVTDLRQVDGLLRVLRLPPPIKLTATI